MKVVYSPRYHIDIGPHVFLTAKYPGVLRRLLDAKLVSPDAIVEPTPASWHTLGLIHTAEYLEKARSGTFSPEELAQLELPWSPAVVEGFRLMTGGTVVTAHHALEDGIAGHVGGGFHHAFANHGEGFCLFNDVAVAVASLRRDGRLRRAAIVDCDVHHGNGTALIFEHDPEVFTFSIHQQHNYPLFKPRSRLDIGLPDGTGDEPYLAHLDRAMPAVLASDPEILFYLAGADPFREDQLGGLSLTFEGLRRRDRLVIMAARRASVPVVITLAGGYARRLEDTIAIHAATIEEVVGRSL